MDIPKNGCERHALIVSLSTKWVFAHIFNHYFGSGSLVLVGEGEAGKDLEMQATDPWLEANRVLKIGLTQDDGRLAWEHIKDCDSKGCQEAKMWLDKLTPFFRRGAIPGGAGLAIMSALQRRDIHAKCRISRDNGFSAAIEEIKPFILWFKGK